MDLGSFLRISSEERPGQVTKCPRLMARTKVEGTGLNAVAWRKPARSVCVWAQRIALVALDRIGLVVGLGTTGGRWTSSWSFGAKGIVQRPLVFSRGPTIITRPSLIIFTSYLLNRATQSSSQSLLIEIRDPVVSPSRTKPDEAGFDSCEARGMETVWVALILFPSAAITHGPVGVGIGSEQCSWWRGLMKWSVAPESAMARGTGGEEGGIEVLWETTAA